MERSADRGTPAMSRYVGAHRPHTPIFVGHFVSRERDVRGRDQGAAPGAHHRGRRRADDPIRHEQRRALHVPHRRASRAACSGLRPDRFREKGSEDGMRLWSKRPWLSEPVVLWTRPLAPLSSERVARGGSHDSGLSMRALRYTGAASTLHSTWKANSHMETGLSSGPE
jgi:hypothetical protein